MSEQEALVKNAADKGQIEKAGSKAKQREQMAKEAIRTVMSTRQGRKWVWSKLEWCHVFSPTFRQDPCQSAYAEGARLAGLEILKDVNSLGPDAYLQMQQEYLEDKERGL